MVPGVLLLASMMVIAALVLDIGKAYLVQRQMQASIDAAALAAAQFLPDSAAAAAAAEEYGPNGTKNPVKTGYNVKTVVTMRCIKSAPGCSPEDDLFNGVSIKASADVKTPFAKIIGFGSLNMKVRSTACSPCSSKPLDIMLVLDRTGSMCDAPGDDRPTGKCVDLNQAKGAIRTFLTLMDPMVDRVGLAVSPPAVGPAAGSGDSPSDVCSMPVDTNRWFGYDAWSPWWMTGAGTGYRGQDRAFYVVSSMTDDDVDNDPTDDYVLENPDGSVSLNTAKSGLVQTVNCVKANGSTSYSMAIVEAQAELDSRGRGGVQDVIVFFTDGGANVTQETAGGHWNGSSPWNMRPCGAGVQASDRLPSSTIVYTIGYNLENQEDSRQRCNTPETNGHSDFSNPKEVCQAWGCTPQAALLAIASEADNFYYTADATALKKIFVRIAADLQRPASRLIADDTP